MDDQTYMSSKYCENYQTMIDTWSEYVLLDKCDFQKQSNNTLIIYKIEPRTEKNRDILGNITTVS